MLFNVTYWQPDDNENDGFFKTVKCALSDVSYKQLFIEKPPDFIELIVNEGELLIIARANLYQLEQVKEVIPVSR